MFNIIWFINIASLITITVCDYRRNTQITGLNGQLIPLYSGLYYSVQNVHTGQYLMGITSEKGSLWIQSQKIEISDQNGYLKIVPDTNLAENSNYYKLELIRGYASFHFEYVKEDIYRLHEYKSHYWSSDMIERCTNNCVDEKFKWKIRLHPDYQLNASIVQRKQNINIMDLMKNKQKKKDVFETIVENKYDTPIEHLVSEKMTTKESFEVSSSDSFTNSYQYFNNFKIDVSISSKVDVWVVKGEAKTNTTHNLRWEWNTDKTHMDSKSNLTSIERVIEIQETLSVKPHSKVNITYSLDWVDNLEKSIQAKIEFTARGPRFLSDRNLPNVVIRELLDKNKFVAVYNQDGKNKLYSTIDMKIKGSFGLNQYFSVNEISGGKTELVQNKTIVSYQLL